MSTYHNFVKYSNAIGWVVPQRVYERKEHGFSPGPIISFTQNNNPGVFMESAARPEFCIGDDQSTGMTDGNVVVDLRHRNLMIKIRIEWFGCQPYDESIIIEEHVAGERRNATKAVLAHKVAKIVQRFRTRYQRDSSFDQRYAPDKYDFNKFVLHELGNVSKGSYQPVIVIAGI